MLRDAIAVLKVLREEHHNKGIKFMLPASRRIDDTKPSPSGTLDRGVTPPAKLNERLGLEG